MSTEVNIKSGGSTSKWVLFLLFAFLLSIFGCIYLYNKNKENKAKVEMLDQNVYALKNRPVTKLIKLDTVYVQSADVTRLSLDLKTYKELYAKEAKEVKKLTKNLSDVNSIASASVVVSDTVKAIKAQEKDTIIYSYSGKYMSIINEVINDNSTFSYKYDIKIKLINTIEKHSILFGLFKWGEKRRESQLIIYDENAKINEFNQIDIYK